jgi:Ca2+-binding EF-hand superfamily protein
MGPTSRILSFMRSLDTDGDGVLSRSELRRGLGEMGVSTEMVYLSVI